MNRRRLATVGRAWRAAHPGWSLWLSDAGRVWVTGPGCVPGLQATLTADSVAGISQAIAGWHEQVAAAVAWHAMHPRPPPVKYRTTPCDPFDPGMLSLAGNNART